MYNDDVRVLREAADLIEAAPKLVKGAFQAPVDVLEENGRVRAGVDLGLILKMHALLKTSGIGIAGSPLCYCTGGALFTGQGSISAFKVLADYLGIPCNEGTYEYDGGPCENCVGTPEAVIFIWNDAPERTKEEVVAALRGAADEEERKGESK